MSSEINVRKMTDEIRAIVLQHQDVSIVTAIGILEVIKAETILSAYEKAKREVSK